MIPDMTNEQLMEAAEVKTSEIVTVNADVWYRQQLVEEMKKRNLEYAYDKILKGKYAPFSEVK
jgi:hypothetical protein